MLTLALKNGNPVDLYTPLYKSIFSVCGPETASQIDSPLKSLQKVREDLLNVLTFHGDTPKLEKLTNSVMTYLSMWASITQGFSFGKGKVFFLI